MHKQTTLIDIVADPVCPWCYVGLNIFQRAARDALADLNIVPRYRAYQLNPGTPPEGYDRQQYYAAKFPEPGVLQAQREALTNAAKAAGFAFDPALPTRIPNTLAAHALIRAAHYSGLQDAVSREIYNRFWWDDADLGDRSVLQAAGLAAGMEPAKIDAALGQGLGDGHSAMRAEAAHEAEGMRRAGVSGVPTFIVNERAAFSGALPPADFVRAIRKGVEISPALKPAGAPAGH